MILMLKLLALTSFISHHFLLSVDDLKKGFCVACFHYTAQYAPICLIQ